MAGLVGICAVSVQMAGSRAIASFFSKAASMSLLRRAIKSLLDVSFRKFREPRCLTRAMAPVLWVPDDTSDLNLLLQLS